MKTLRSRPALALLLATGLAGLPVPSRAEPVKTDPGIPKPETAPALIQVLTSDADTFAKARACQQLAIVGSPGAVPALAALLADEKLGNHARAALETMPDPAADAALREALGRLQGKLRVGVVNSIGVRRDPKAVGDLVKLAGDRASGAQSEALLALGRIGTDEAMVALRKALADGPAELRPAAAEGCVLAAERMTAPERREAAMALYDAVRGADVPGPLREAATLGAIRARGAAGLPLLVELLKSGDPVYFAIALRLVRELPGAEVTKAVIAEMGKLKPADQAVLIPALADRNDPAALGAVEALAASDAAGVRLAALKALGKVGASSSVTVLLKAVQDARDDAEVAVAAASLGQIRAPDANNVIATVLVVSAPPAARARLIGILADRGGAIPAGELVKLASDADPAVAKAAFRALSSLSRPADLPEMIRRASACKDESVRGTAEGAVVEACAQGPDPAGRSEALRAALAECKDAAAKASLLRMLAGVGDFKALRAVTAALGDPDAAVMETALRALADWPDATAASALLGVVGSATDPERRKTALRGVVRAARLASADLALPSRQAVGWMTAAAAAARDAADRRVVLSGLAALKGMAGLQLIRPLLEDPEVADDAALAVIQVAKQMPPSPPRLMAKSLIEKALATTKNGTVRSQAEKTLKEIPGDGAALPSPVAAVAEPDLAKLEFRPLFDSRTLNGWDGDTYASFRVEDGAIVGGQLQRPVPRNEFLCTTRPFGDFVLRLECKLVKCNAGIQIRSRRVAGSAEVCGYQADMDCGPDGGIWGCLYDECRRGMLVTADRAVVKGAVKPGDWNRYEIRCIGPRIQLLVNDVLTADYVEKDGAILQSGVIGLQIHAGAPGESWYRNIAIAEAP